MVAALGANRASDAYVAAELGALVHTRGLIEDPRWRLDAVVALLPALHRFGASLDGVKAEVRKGIAGAVCPRPLRPVLGELVELVLAGGDVPGVIEALWNRSHAGAAAATVECALRAGAPALAHRAVRDSRGLRGTLTDAIATGVIGGRFVARSDDPAGEYPASLPLLVALVDDVARTGDRRTAAAAERSGADAGPLGHWYGGSGLAVAERVAERVPTADRPIALAQLARAELVVRGTDAALARIRAIRPRGPRAGAGLLLTQAALARGDVDAARAIADTTESALYRQRAALAIAHHLAATGEACRAMRALGPVRHPALAAERILLHEEIVLAARRMRARMYWPDHRVIDAARPAPAWTTLGAPRVEPGRRIRLLHAGLYLLIYLTHRRDEVFANGAAALLRRHLDDSASRRALLRLLATLELEPREAVMAVRPRIKPAVLSALWAEHLRMRTEALLRWHPAVAPTCPPEIARRAAPESLERALHDEAIARSPAGPRKRRVLVSTARYCLRTAFARPTETSAAVIDARLRSLLYLGGVMARDAIAGAINPPLPATAAPHLVARVFEALCVLDPDEAVRIAFELARGAEAVAITAAGGGVDLDRALAIAELHGGLPAGFTRAWSAAHRKLGGARGLAWLGELAATSRDTGAPLTPDALAWIARQHALPPTPRALIDELAGVTGTLATVPLGCVADRVARDRDLLERLIVARPARVDARMPAWSVDKWTALLAHAAAMPVATSTVIVERAARAVPVATAAFRAGDLARAGVPVTSRFAVGGEPFHLQLLDKRGDLLTYLRFADIPLYSCYRSDSSYYADGDYDTRDALLAVWRDPLAFCFRVDRGPARRPTGFVFGGFAQIEDDHAPTAIVLNGLYVRPRTAVVRAAVLAAVEAALAPLGIDRIGIASEHGGHGPIPTHYKVLDADVRLTRWRALVTGGRPVDRSYDDISTTVNRPINTDHMFWASGLLAKTPGGTDA